MTPDITTFTDYDEALASLPKGTKSVVSMSNGAGWLEYLHGPHGEKFTLIAYLRGRKPVYDVAPGIHQNWLLPPTLRGLR